MDVRQIGDLGEQFEDTPVNEANKHTGRHVLEEVYNG
jgi:hypothetical protein